MNSPLRMISLRSSRSPRLANATLAAFVLLGLSTPVPAGLSLELADGTRISVDRVAAADDSCLTVATVAPGSRVERSVPWPRIAGATLDGEWYSPEELRLALGLTNTGHLIVDPPPAPPCSPLFPIPYSSFPPGRVIGVQPDPLAAYADLAPSVYPAGVPTAEAPFARALLRERRRLETIAPFGTLNFAPPPWQAPAPLPPILPPPIGLPPAEFFPPIGR